MSKISFYSNGLCVTYDLIFIVCDINIIVDVVLSNVTILNVYWKHNMWVSFPSCIN